WAQTTRGEWAAGIAAGRRAVELAPDDLAVALAESFLGIGYVEKGEADAALPYLERAAATYGRLRFPQLEGLLIIFLAQAELARARGERPALERHLGEARARFVETRAPVWAARVDELARASAT